MSPDDRWRIGHMIEAAEQALALVQGRHRADLDTDAMLSLALTRAVEIVGESAAQVLPAFFTDPGTRSTGCPRTLGLGFDVAGPVGGVRRRPVRAFPVAAH